MSLSLTNYSHGLKGVTVFNISLVFLIATGYWKWIGFSKQPLLEKSYLIATQLGWLGLIPVLLSVFILIIRLLSKRVALWSSLTLFAFISAYFATDTLVFSQYKFHINGIVLELFLADGVINFSGKIWFQFITFVLVLFSLQGLVHFISIKYNRKLSKFNNLFLLFWVSCLIYSQVLHAWKDASYDTSITNMTRYFPLYRPLTAKSFFYENNLVNQELARKQNRISTNNGSQLDYPKTNIEYIEKQNKLNILFIVIDALRYSDFNAKYTPHMAKFAEKSVQFKQHLSGGNSTQAGIFSLFYGLPSPYWVSFRNSGTRPALLETADQQDYEFKILSSAQLNRPPFDRTVFNNIDDLRVYTPADTSEQRDKLITEDMQGFLKTRDKSKAFFGFLFYDSVHSAEIPEDEALIFQPSWTSPSYLELGNDIDPEPFHNLYRNALYYTDKKISRVLNTLKEEGLDDNTVVVITSDHGEEFNDNHKNYWGHGGNYTESQIHVPLIVNAPNLTPETIYKNTTHIDIVPTIMQDYLGVTTVKENYTLGSNLFSSTDDNNPVIVGSYNDYAVVTNEGIGVVNDLGSIEYFDPKMNPMKKPTVSTVDLRNIISDLNKFYK